MRVLVLKCIEHATVTRIAFLKGQVHVTVDPPKEQGDEVIMMMMILAMIMTPTPQADALPELHHTAAQADPPEEGRHPSRPKLNHATPQGGRENHTTVQGGGQGSTNH